MTPKATIYVRTQDSFTINNVPPAPVSIPAPPFEIPPTDRSETEPSKRVIRGKIGPEDKRWLRSMARQAKRDYYSQTTV